MKKQQGCNTLINTLVQKARHRAIIVMNLLFLLPLVSPRARARDPIAVTDDGLVHRQHHPIAVANCFGENRHASVLATPSPGAKNGTTFVLRRNHQFVHIPKCGGSTIERFLRLPFQGHREMHHGGPWGQARPIVV